MNNNKNNENKEREVIHYEHDEVMKMMDVVGSFTNKGLRDDPPNLVIITGGVGSGKTTFRREKYGSGYVNLDFVDVLHAVKKVIGENNPKLTDTAATTFRIIMNDSFAEKKNIVIEIIGDGYELVEKLLDSITKLGYHIQLNFVYCDPVEAYSRHVKAVKNDPDYVSAFYAQDVVLAYLFEYLELGEYPVRTDEPNSDSFLTK